MKNQTELEQVLSACKVCRVGFLDGEGMAIVPMNFGYEFTPDRLVLYFHSGPDGRKIRAFRESPTVCFEMDGDARLVVYGSGESACDYGFAYCSAMGTGRISLVEDGEEKRRGLELLTLHQSGRRLPINDRNFGRTAVMKLAVESVTTKRHGK